MPELPEVETIARVLAAELRGRRILAVELRRPASVADAPPALSCEAFRERLPGRRVARVWRRGKLLVLDLVAEAGGLLHLAVRLGMSGRLWLAPPGAAPEKHTHVILTLDGEGLDEGPRLFFTDPRTFGSVRALTPEGLAAWPFFATLGPEPLEMTPGEFTARFAGRSGRIKALLLDQHVLAGVGNIYADESLFRAGVSPEARADTVSEARLRCLHAALAEVLREAIAANGSSIRDYRDAHGHAGAFQNAFRAYGRAGQPCLVCGAALTKTTVAGRTTTYCRKCQR